MVAALCGGGKLWRVALALMLCVPLYAHGAPTVRHLRVCAADVPVPPFLFWTPGQHDRASDIQGYSSDLLQKISERLQYGPPEIEVLPMPRCLKEAKDGRYDIVLNLLPSQIDLKPLLVSVPYYDLHSHYFYSRHAHPQGLNISNLADLRRFRVCGLYGYSYEEYGIPESNIDTGSKDHRALLLKLKADRCDLFIERREIWAGLYLTYPGLQNLFTDPDLEDAPLLESTPLQFRLAISRKLPGASGLLSGINDTISSLRSTRELDRMMERYMH